MTRIIFKSSLSDEMRDNILARLKQIEIDNNVRIIFAIESGSRAWGFPSPDSDYDARFVYARRVEDYLTLNPVRDVIELPIEGDYDINGWDIKKALNLLLKPNPVLLEWLSSPIRYMWNDEQCEQLISFSKKLSHGPASLHHYINLGKNIWRHNIDRAEGVKLKKYFYVLRPAMALRWIRMNPDQIPPMNFQDLMAGVDLPAPLLSELQDLLRAKAQTNELGTGQRNPRLDAFILEEFAQAEALTKIIRVERQGLRAQADALFRKLIMPSEA